RQDGQAEPVRKVLLLVQFVVAAQHAGGQRVFGGAGLVHAQAVVASGALPDGRRGLRQAGGAIAFGAGKVDLHGTNPQGPPRPRVQGRGEKKIHSVRPVLSSSSWLVSSPRKQQITTTYRMPVAD